jgi:L-ascorbate metabolism protein UlaG (beta-lactamase superfamily)
MTVEVAFLGHACNIMNIDGWRLMSDPHLFDSYGGQLFSYFPSRRIAHEAIGRLDAIYVSHRHRDHFDVASLALLDKRLPVICPQDKEILYGLNKLGFSDVNVIADWESIEVGRATLTFTPSTYRVPENGLLVCTPEAKVWNMVDTVVTAADIAAVRQLARMQIDLVLWPYQPLMETDAIDCGDLRFPVERFEAAVDNLRRIDPGAAAPYADGQVGFGPYAWINHYRFPVTDAEATHALDKVLGQVARISSRPGQRYAVAGGVIETLEPLPFVHSVEARPGHRQADGTHPIPRMRSSTAHTSLREAEVLDEVERRLRHAAQDARLAHCWRVGAQWNLIYQVRIELAVGRWAAVCFDCASGKVERVASPELLDAPAYCRAVVSVGTLASLLRGELHFVSAYLAGLLRSSNRVYCVRAQAVDSPAIEVFPERVKDGAVLSPTSFLNVLTGQTVEMWRLALDFELSGVPHEIA